MKIAKQQYFLRPLTENMLTRHRPCKQAREGRGEEAPILEKFEFVEKLQIFKVKMRRLN